MKPLIFCAFLAIAVTSKAEPAKVETYKVDPVHSMLLAKVKHLGIGNIYGRFNDISGTINFDPAAPEKSTIEFQVKSESVDTGNDKRDQHMRSPDFLDAKQFPAITFKSTSIKKKDDDEFEVTGDLTIKGVTKSVTAELDYFGKGKGMQGEERIGGEVEFSLKRSDFGVTFMVGPVSDEVELTLAVEGVK